MVLFLIKNPDADDDNDGINDVIGCMSMCECNITKTQYTFFLDKISSIAWMDGGGKRQTKTIRQNNINLRKGFFSTHYLFEYVFFSFILLNYPAVFLFVCFFSPRRQTILEHNMKTNINNGMESIEQSCDLQCLLIVFFPLLIHS